MTAFQVSPVPSTCERVWVSKQKWSEDNLRRGLHSFVWNSRLCETLSAFLGHGGQARERPRAKHSTQLAS